MTPTRSQLDAALPRVPSGIGAMSGDLTDPDEPGSDRAIALDWLERLYGAAYEAMNPHERSGQHAMSLAILRAAGIEPDNVRAVTYGHEVGEAPELTVTFLAWDADTHEFAPVTQRWTVAPGASDHPNWTDEQIDGVRTTIDWLRSLRQSRETAPESPESDENADRVPTDPENRTGAHSGSVWPAPKATRRVLSPRAYPPAPGITYYDTEEAQ